MKVRRDKKPKDGGNKPSPTYISLLANQGKPMAKNEKSSSKLGTLASKALTKPGSLSNAQIKSLGASVLTQRPDRPSAKTSKK